MKAMKKVLSLSVLLGILGLNCSVNISAKEIIPARTEAEIKAENIAQMRESVKKYGEGVYISITLAEGIKIEDCLLEGTKCKQLSNIEPLDYQLIASEEVMLKYIDMYENDDTGRILFMSVQGYGTPHNAKEDKGDINSDGKTDITDLIELSLALLGDTELTETQLQIADIDGDGAVKLTDLAKLRQFLSKQISSL